MAGERRATEEAVEVGIDDGEQEQGATRIEGEKFNIIKGGMRRALGTVSSCDASPLP